MSFERTIDLRAEMQSEVRVRFKFLNRFAFDLSLSQLQEFIDDLHSAQNGQAGSYVNGLKLAHEEARLLDKPAVRFGSDFCKISSIVNGLPAEVSTPYFLAFLTQVLDLAKALDESASPSREPLQK